MRVPLGWVRDYVDLPDVTPRQMSDALVGVGLEVEAVHEIAVDGPLVVGRVLEYVDEPQSNGKTTRWCHVDVGSHNPDREPSRGIVCGAHNFAVGDHVVVALPGCVLPGGFAITARRTYGHVSDGMICSVRELGIGDEHDGILVLTDSERRGAEVGADANALLGLPDAVLDIAVKPDRSYCLSVRGIARELATVYGVPFRDPADAARAAALPETGARGHPVEIRDGADRIALRRVSGFDPTASSPLWMRSRISLAGMRSISLAVDITNYVMLELGQPLHAFDATKLQGPIVVRRARAGERLRTLDGADRTLDPDDLLITDGSGPIALAGTMGGASTEMGAESTDIVIEAAHFDAVTVAREARRHKLPSEASRRFERGVDHELGPVASARAVSLLAELGGATYVGVSEVDRRVPEPPIRLPSGHASRVVGTTYADDVVSKRLRDVGCAVDGPDADGSLVVTPPSWRPDLTDPNDLVEEIARLEGYDRVPSRAPGVRARERRPGTARQQRTRAGRALASAGWSEVQTYPFLGTDVLDGLGLPAGDRRRLMLRLANPLSEEEPYLRTTLLPGLVTTLRRNLSRGATDLALYEIGSVFLPRRDAPAAPRPPVTRRPTDDELAALEAALPDQPVHVAGLLTGDAETGGWWGPGRPATWSDAVEAARIVAASVRVEAEVRPGDLAPWHPGRCAELVVAGRPVGAAGELHPRVVAALDLPARTCAFELDLTAIGAAAPGLVQGPTLSAFPLAKEDVALVVEESVPAAAVEAALRLGAGELLESVRLFDVYRDARLGEGKKSLAYALRFRAPDRTLTVEETSEARERAVAEARRSTGAVQRT